MISLTEKMKLYGRLASVGTTRRQQKKIVYYEAVVMGLAGVPLGVISGVGATAVLLQAVNGLVKDALGFRLIFVVSVWPILLSAVLSGVTVYLSASGSARRAARVSPISAIRANDTVREAKRMSGVQKFTARQGKIPHYGDFHRGQRGRVYRTVHFCGAFDVFHVLSLSRLSISDPGQYEQLGFL